MDGRETLWKRAPLVILTDGQTIFRGDLSTTNGHHAPGDGACDGNPRRIVDFPFPETLLRHVAQLHRSIRQAPGGMAAQGRVVARHTWFAPLRRSSRHRASALTRPSQQCGMRPLRSVFFLDIRCAESASSPPRLAGKVARQAAGETQKHTGARVISYVRKLISGTLSPHNFMTG